MTQEEANETLIPLNAAIAGLLADIPTEPASQKGDNSNVLLCLLLYDRN